MNDQDSHSHDDGYASSHSHPIPYGVGCVGPFTVTVEDDEAGRITVWAEYRQQPAGFWAAVAGVDDVISTYHGHPLKPINPHDGDLLLAVATQLAHQELHRRKAGEEER